MKLTEEQLSQLGNPALTSDERALLRCRFAAELIHTGRYESARETLGELWQGVGKRPEMDRLKPFTAAEVLLQCGVLSGWLGSVLQVPDAQEKAKDLLTVALRKFQSQGQKAKVAEAQYELGRCYFRLGAYDEARLILDEAINGLDDRDAGLKAKALIRRSLVEIWTGRYHDAWEILKEAESFFEKCDDAIKGRWHGQVALVLDKLANAERNTCYLDRAIIEYTAAIHHYEQARHERYCAVNLNNLAMLLYEFGRYDEAHEYLDRATVTLTKLNDDGLLAQVDETRSRVLLAEGRYQEANRVIAGVVQTFEKGSEFALLADALTIQGVVWARLGACDSSLQILRRAVSVSQDSGAASNAGRAALTLIEEHGAARLSDSQIYSVYRRADKLLKDTQDAENIARLRACALIVVERLFGVKLSDEDFSLPVALRAQEAKFIEQALEEEQGSVTRAAKRLGVKHQTLIHLLRKRHRNLLNKRTPPIPRRRSIVRGGSARKPRAAEKQVRAVTILHAEDDRLVADAVRATLEQEGWAVVTCADGAAALRSVEGDTPYDLLLLDYDLPNVSGLELVRRARQLPHRRRTPVLMLSAGDVEAAAWRAGVDAFLRKPEDAGRLTDVVARLLPKRR